MNVHKNARLTPAAQAGWTTPVGCGRGGVVGPHHARMAGPASARGGAQASRPQFGAEAISAPARGRDRGPAPTTDDRATDRPQAGHGQIDRSAGPALHGARLLDPKPPIVRYERGRTGEMINLDIKMSGRINGIGHASPDGGPARTTSAGDSCTSASMPPRGWPAPRRCPPKALWMRQPFSGALQPGSPAMASSSNGP